MTDQNQCQLDTCAISPCAWEGKPVRDISLVLEGGAMRGMFTAGVLDVFMDRGLVAKEVIGVSAGALNGYNYVAGAVGRTCYLNLKYCNDPQYLSMRSFVKTGNVFGREYSFDEIPNHKEPFCYDNFRKSPMHLTAVASHLETGEAAYASIDDPQDDLAWVIASSSLPLLSQIVEINNQGYLDGGTTDSVPIEYSMQHFGNLKQVVVLTRDASYCKKPEKLMPLIRQKYAEYPYYVEQIEYRHHDYNRCYRRLARLEDEGKIFIIRPSSPINISNMERDPEMIFSLYQEGVAQACKCWDELCAFLDIDTKDA